MPTYSYKCSDCGHRFDRVQSMSDDPINTCEACNKESANRVISGGVGIAFKGSGFYVTDSSGSSSDAGSKSD